MGIKIFFRSFDLSTFKHGKMGIETKWCLLKIIYNCN